MIGLVRSNAFRIALAFACGLTVTTYVVFAVVDWQLYRSNVALVRLVLEDEAAKALPDSSDQLRRRLQLRLTQDLRHLDYVGFYDPTGKLIFGNVAGLPKIPPDGKAHLVHAAPAQPEAWESENAIFVAHRRADGGILLLGRSLVYVDQLENAMLHVSVETIVPVIVIALLTGAFVSVRASRRLSKIQDAIARVMAGDLHVRADLVFGGAGLQAEPGYGSDGRQRLTPESESRNGKQVVGAPQLRGGMPLKGQQSIVPAHSVAVVDDTNQLTAAGLHLHTNPRGAGIERVLQQLLDHRRGPLYNLPRSDLVGHLVGQHTNSSHSNSLATGPVRYWAGAGRTRTCLAAAPISSLRVVRHAIDFDLGAPEAMPNVLARYKSCKIQPAPAVQTNTAQRPQQDIGFMLPMWPQFRYLERELGVVHCRL